MDLVSALRMPSRCESMLLRRRVFRAFVAYLLNQAVNPTTRCYGWLAAICSYGWIRYSLYGWKELIGSAGFDLATMAERSESDDRHLARFQS